MDLAGEIKTLNKYSDKSDINNINQTDNKSGCCGQKSQ